MNADAVGALNMARKYETIIPSPSWGRDNGVVAHPLLLRWNGMRWEPKKGNEQPTNERPRSKNLPALAVESVKSCFFGYSIPKSLKAALRLNSTHSWELLML